MGKKMGIGGENKLNQLKNPLKNSGLHVIKAERKGFEPSIQLPVYQLSRLAPSTTRTPL